MDENTGVTTQNTISGNGPQPISAQPVFIDGPVEPSKTSGGITRPIIYAPIENINTTDNGFSYRSQSLPPTTSVNVISNPADAVPSQVINTPSTESSYPSSQVLPPTTITNSSFIVNSQQPQNPPTPTWIKAENTAVALPADEYSWRDNPQLASAVEWVFAPLPLGRHIFSKNIVNDEFFIFHKNQSYIFGVLNVIAMSPILLLWIPIISVWIAAFIWIPLSVFLFGRLYYSYSAYHGERPIVPLLPFFSRLISKEKNITNNPSSPGS